MSQRQALQVQETPAGLEPVGPAGRALAAADLEGRFSGHSLRVGASQLLAGRWPSTSMPGRFAQRSNPTLTPSQSSTLWHLEQELPQKTRGNPLKSLIPGE